MEMEPINNCKQRTPTTIKKLKIKTSYIKTIRTCELLDYSFRNIKTRKNSMTKNGL